MDDAGRRLSGPWAVRLPAAPAAEALAPLRREPGLEVCAADEGALWVRGPAADAALRRALARLPAQGRYEVDPAGDLRPPGARLPVGALPEGPWRPLSAWLGVAPPPVVRPAATPAPVSLALERDPAPPDPPPEPDLLRTSLEAWAARAATAPALRLSPLAFAAGDGGRVLVRGRPLPPLRGERFATGAPAPRASDDPASVEGVAVPLGYRWTPPVDAAVAAVVLGLAPGDVALLLPDGGWQRVEGERFVPAARDAVRRAAAAEEPRRDGSPREGA